MKSEWMPADLGRFFCLKVYWFSENLYKKMANVKVLFYDPQGVNDLQVVVNNQGDIKLLLREGNPGSKEVNSMIVFDVDTAVKFSKELRRQIAISKGSQLKIESHE